MLIHTLILSRINVAVYFLFHLKYVNLELLSREKIRMQLIIEMWLSILYYFPDKHTYVDVYVYF